MKNRAWLIIVGLALLGLVFLTYGMLRRLERNQLFVLEQEIHTTAKALVPEARDVLLGNRHSMDSLRDILETTQNATGSRIRILDAKRELLADSLSGVKSQPQLRFRPEIQRAFSGYYGAYTRFSDETDRSLALFVAIPILESENVIGAVYVSHSTDEILRQLGVLRRTANQVLIGLAGALFLAAGLMTTKVQNTLAQLRTVTGRVSDTQPEHLPTVKGDKQVAEIGENFNRLIDSLRQKIAELEDEKAKTKRFLEEVAHELKTPMTGLLGSLETLKSEKLKEQDTQRMWHNLEKEAERLSELTSSLLELQKLDYTQMSCEPFDLLSVAETVADSYQTSAQRKKVELTIEDCEHNIVMGEAHQIQRVVENLVENAVRCTTSGSGIILRLSNGSNKTTFSVLDRGPGPPDASLLAPHKKGDKAPGSLGLGLSIASEILKKHGSALEIESRDQGGSIFSFALARQREEDL